MFHCSIFKFTRWQEQGKWHCVSVFLSFFPKNKWSRTTVLHFIVSIKKNEQPRSRFEWNSYKPNKCVLSTRKVNLLFSYGLPLCLFVFYLTIKLWQTSLVNLHCKVAHPNCMIPLEPNKISYIHFPLNYQEKKKQKLLFDNVNKCTM